MTLSDPSPVPFLSTLRRRAPLAFLLALALLLVAPSALAQAGQAQPEDGAATNGTNEAADPDESVAFEDEQGQIYGATLLLAVVATGIVIAVVLVKQHWRVKNR